MHDILELGGEEKLDNSKITVVPIVIEIFCPLLNNKIHPL